MDERALLIRIGDEEADGAPHFPRVGLCLDNQTGMIIGQQMSTADHAFGHNALRTLELTLTTLGRRPAVVLFVNPHLKQALEPWLKTADLRGGLSKPSEQLEQVWSFLS